MNKLYALLSLFVFVSCEGFGEVLATPEVQVGLGEAAVVAVQSVASGQSTGSTLTQVGAALATVAVGVLAEVVRRQRKAAKAAS